MPFFLFTPRMIVISRSILLLLTLIGLACSISFLFIFSDMTPIAYCLIIFSYLLLLVIFGFSDISKINILVNSGISLIIAITLILLGDGIDQLYKFESDFIISLVFATLFVSYIIFIISFFYFKIDFDHNLKVYVVNLFKNKFIVYGLFLLGFFFFYWFAESFFQSKLWGGISALTIILAIITFASDKVDHTKKGKGDQ